MSRSDWWDLNLCSHCRMWCPIQIFSYIQSYMYVFTSQKQMGIQMWTERSGNGRWSSMNKAHENTGRTWKEKLQEGLSQESKPQRSELWGKRSNNSSTVLSLYTSFSNFNSKLCPHVDISAPARSESAIIACKCARTSPSCQIVNKAFSEQTTYYMKT